MEEITADDILLLLIEPINWIGVKVLGLRGGTLRDWVFAESTGCAELIAAALNRAECNCWTHWQYFSIDSSLLALQNCLHQHALANWDGFSSRDEFLARAVLGVACTDTTPAQYMNDFRRVMNDNYNARPATPRIPDPN